MLKNFWEQKKHLIQLAGILTAIGALFLSITPPENETAANALLNIQFAWLIIITVALFILFMSLITLLIEIEEETKKKYKINIEETISFLMIFISGWILVNLWIYVFKLYKDTIVKFMRYSGLIISIIIGTLVFYFVNRIFKKLARIIRMIIGSFIFSILYGAWVEFSDLKFSFIGWLKNMSLSFGVLIIFVFGVILYGKIKKGKPEELIKK